MPKFSDLNVSAALLGRRAITPYPFPTLEGVSIGMRLLDEAEQDDARIKAQKYCKGREADLLSDPQFMDRALQRFTLLACCFNVDDVKGGKFFASHEEVQRLDVTLTQLLYEMYETHRMALDPLLYCPAEGVNDLIEALGKPESGQVRLSLYDLPTLRSFVLSMASMLRATRQ